MDIQERIKKNLETVISLKKLIVLWIILFVIFIIQIIIRDRNHKADILNSKYVFISGKVNKINDKIDPSNSSKYYLIKDKWFFISGISIKYIKKGDILQKNSGSDTLYIYDKESKIKWKGHIGNHSIIKQEKPIIKLF